MGRGLDAAPRGLIAVTEPAILAGATIEVAVAAGRRAVTRDSAVALIAWGLIPSKGLVPAGHATDTTVGEVALTTVVVWSPVAVLLLLIVPFLVIVVVRSGASVATWEEALA